MPLIKTTLIFIIRSAPSIQERFHVLVSATKTMANVEEHTMYVFKMR